MSCLFLRHCFVRNFFDYDDSEVIECMPRFPKVFVDRYCIVSLDVIPVFVYSPVSLLGLQFPDILFLVAFVAESEVYCVGRLTSSTLPDFESFLPRFVCEEVGIDHVGTAFCVRSTTAWRASSFRFRFLSHYFVVLDSSLPQDVS